MLLYTEKVLDRACVGTTLEVTPPELWEKLAEATNFFVQLRVTNVTGSSGSVSSLLMYSNDGLNWTSALGPSGAVSLATTSYFYATVTGISARYVRFYGAFNSGATSGRIEIWVAGRAKKRPITSENTLGALSTVAMTADPDVTPYAPKLANMNSGYLAKLARGTARASVYPVVGRPVSPCCDDCAKPGAKPCGAAALPRDPKGDRFLDPGVPLARPNTQAQPWRDRRMSQREFARSLGTSITGVAPIDEPCFVPFTDQQFACLEAALEGAIAATTIRPDGSQSLWQRVIAANRTSQVTARYQEYNTAWLTAWASAAARCRSLFPPDAWVGPNSVFVQVSRATDGVAYLLDDGPRGAHQIRVAFHGYRGVPNGWLDPYCGVRPFQARNFFLGASCPPGCTLVTPGTFLPEVIAAVQAALRAAYAAAAALPNPDDVAAWNQAFAEAFNEEIGRFGSGAAPGISPEAANYILSVFTAGAYQGRFDGTVAFLNSTRDNTGRLGSLQGSHDLLAYCRCMGMLEDVAPWLEFLYDPTLIF